MKKILSVLLLCLTGSLLIAEEGYKGMTWNYCYIGETSNYEKFEATEKEFNLLNEYYHVENIYFQNNVILGKKIRNYFVFTENVKEFIGSGYIISSEKTHDLLSKFSKFCKKLNNKNQVESYYDFYKDDFKNLNINKEEVSEEALEAGYFMETWGLAREIEIDGENFINLKPESELPNGKSSLYIYDYNDDTRVYIYENFIKGKTAVVYVPHEQDY